jgi:hypothetical protein
MKRNYIVTATRRHGHKEEVVTESTSLNTSVELAERVFGRYSVYETKVYELKLVTGIGEPSLNEVYHIRALCKHAKVQLVHVFEVEQDIYYCDDCKNAYHIPPADFKSNGVLANEEG